MKADRGSGVLITGCSGFIGTRMMACFRQKGYRVQGLSRNPSQEGIFRWDPDTGYLDPEALDGIHTIIHLAGENIAAGRWTSQRRKRILESRINGTRTLLEGIKASGNQPSVLISASGVNYYGVSPGKVDEESPAGDGFLAEVCQIWEAEALRAKDLGIRTVFLRTGIVLDPEGGALGKLLPVFRKGLGGRIGSGKQGFPWIAMDDLLNIYLYAVREAGISGPVNAVHPEVLSQAEFANCLAEVLNRPALIPLPEIVIQAFLGEMGRETLLADLHVHPEILLKRGFTYRYANVAEALANMLKKQRP